MATQEEIQKFITGLRTLADRYEEWEKVGEIELLHLSKYCWSKEEVQRMVRAIGGKWTKEIPGGPNGDTIWVTSQTTPVTLMIPRNKVCKQIVTWECEPLLLEEEEEGLITEAEVEVPF